MPPRRRTDPAIGRVALAAWARGDADRKQTMTAVRFTLEELAEVAPGHSVEVRVAPAGAVQCVEGLQHTRGTPPNVVEMDMDAWLELVTGSLNWAEGVFSARIIASGERADLTEYMPLQAARIRN